MRWTRDPSEIEWVTDQDEVEQWRRRQWRGMRAMCLFPIGIALGKSLVIISFMSLAPNVSLQLFRTDPEFRSFWITFLASVIVGTLVCAIMVPRFLRWQIVRRKRVAKPRATRGTEFVLRWAWAMPIAFVVILGLVLSPVVTLMTGSWTYSTIGIYMVGCLLMPVSLRVPHGMEPNCSRCGYAQVVPRKTDTCSECGGDLTKPLAIVLGRERVSWWMLAVGVALTAGGLALTVAS